MASRAIPTPPPDAVGLRLHQALSQPLPTAPWDFANAYLPHLVAWLQAKNPRVAPDLCEDAALETVYSVLSRPQQFQPARGKKLLTYLRMSAQRDLINLLKRERRHQHQPFDEQRVELPSAGGNYEGKDREPLQVLCEREDEQERRALLQELGAALPEAEQRVLELMAAGERDTRRFAVVLGINHLPPEEQEAEVKRVKDRIKKRIGRKKDRS